ncbi:hypothetical protein [Vreelandella janggokensis]|uniref:hypothetical protein n=1 Tax=Vreelandella janggokensis TaxID=370767 RepID=UPI002866B031|nr:hypothetical protein [Halomonas janggokensis]MDR5885684.1 hypothetical protein [Halomonas janggokensis]
MLDLIFIMRLPALGYATHAIPVVKNLQTQVPDIEITWVIIELTDKPSTNLSITHNFSVILVLFVLIIVGFISLLSIFNSVGKVTNMESWVE